MASEDGPTVLTGQCHCGGARVRFHLSRPAAAIQVRSCQCSFCRRHGALTASDADGHAEIEADKPLVRYRFGQGGIDILLCGVCGVYVAAVMDAAPGLVATLNVAGLAMAPLDAATPTPMDYDDEDAGVRRARRLVAWTPATLVEAAL